MPAEHGSVGPGVVGALGSTVYVRWGLDLVPGVVVDNYGSGPSRRVVVSVRAESGDETETITVPVSEIVSADTDELAPPGTWLAAAGYERRLSQSINRILRRAVRAAHMSVEDQEHDIVIETPGQRVIIEAKYSSREVLTKELLSGFVEHVRHHQDAAWILVSNAAFPDSLRERLAVLSVAPVRWSGPDDDAALEEAVKAKLAPAR